MHQFVIDHLGAKGEGVTFKDNQEIYVPFTLPNEVIEGQVEGGRIPKPKIISPSDVRVKAACQHFKSCGGCRLQHFDKEALADWKGAVVSEALAKFDISTEIRPTLTSAPHSRRRATLTGRKTKSGTIVGFHGHASDQIVQIQDCPVLDPKVMVAWPIFEQFVLIGASRKANIKIAVTISDVGLDVSVNEAKSLSPQQNQELSILCADKHISRLVWNGEITFQSTAPFISVEGIKLHLVEGGFLQATEFGQNNLIKAVNDIVADRKNTLDLFSGMGTFSLPLAKSRAVHAVENGRNMLIALQNAADHAKNIHPVTTEHRDLFRRPLMPDELQKFDSIVIDPARAGAFAQCQEIAKSKIDKIAFVSCNPSTFARDAKILTDASFSLNWVQPIDQFLWSPHVELVAEFTR